jgi:hypothetical protein
VLVGLTGVLVTGCAGIPTSGNVREGGDLRVQRADDGVPFIGQEPVPGASPANLVAGFLRSSADFQNDHEVGRLYLTAAARQRWRPQAGTVIYDGVASAEEGPDGTVTVQATEFGRIDADGSFTRSPPQTTITREYRVEKSSGQWRIAQLPDGLMLSTADVVDTYRQLALYYLTPTGDTLVPDTVLIPEVSGLTTKLVSRLLRGPTARLRGAVTTAFPDGTALDVSSVPVRDGVATVRLDAAALRGTDDTAREQMSAQLVWTLRQLPGVLYVRITAGGEDLAFSGVPAEQPRDSWLQYAPDRLPASPSSYVVLNGRVGRYPETEFKPVLGSGGSGDPALRSPAVSLDGRRLAAVSADGTTLLVGPMEAGATLQPRIKGLKGTDLSEPSFDPQNNLWVVDRGTGTVLYLADGAEQPQEVAVPRLPEGLAPTGIAVARDGARVALMAGTGKAARFLVAGVGRAETVDPNVPGGERVTLLSAHDPVPGLRGVRDVAWADATSLAVLGSLDEATLRPYYADVDGFDVSDVEPVPGAVTLAAAPPRQPQENPLLVGTSDGKLLQFTSGRAWQVIGPGADPAYPG